jgi:hypothetical protein
MKISSTERETLENSPESTTERDRETVCVYEKEIGRKRDR